MEEMPIIGPIVRAVRERAAIRKTGEHPVVPSPESTAFQGSPSRGFPGRDVGNLGPFEDLRRDLANTFLG